MKYKVKKTVTETTFGNNINETVTEVKATRKGRTYKATQREIDGYKGEWVILGYTERESIEFISEDIKAMLRNVGANYEAGKYKIAV